MFSRLHWRDALVRHFQRNTRVLAIWIIVVNIASVVDQVLPDSVHFFLLGQVDKGLAVISVDRPAAEDRNKT